MTTETFRLIGIAGGSCSGKSTLSNELLRQLDRKVQVLSFDEYFIGLAAIAGMNITDWESPSLYRHDEYIRDLVLLRSGQPIKIACHSRESSEKGVETRIVRPKNLVIVEGFLIFHWHDATDQFQIKFFIDVPEKEIVKRRLARISTPHGWDNPEYIRGPLISGHRRYVLPQIKAADHVLDGTSTTTDLVSKVLKIITG